MNLKQNNKYIAKITIFFGVIVTLILLSLTSLWLNRVIFNTDQFTSITVTAFSEPSSRDSVGELVASRIFVDKPVLEALLSDRLSNYVSGLLGTERAQRNVERLAREGQLFFTSPQREPVTLELSNLKPTIASAQELIQKDETQRRIDVTDIPDSITIIDTSTIPNFHSTAVYLHLMGPFTLIATLSLAGYWLKKGGRQNRYKRSRILMLVVLTSALVALIVGPLAEPSFISFGRDAPTQSLLSNLYKSFSEPFRNQALWLGTLTAFALIATTVWHKFNSRYSIKLKIMKK